MKDPSILVATAKPGKRIIGWKLRSGRDELLDRFSPRYSRTIADHVTLAVRVAASTPLPDAVCAAIVGRADDGTGVEAVVVAINGSTERPDGSTYHVTWSLEPGRSPQESNDVIRYLGWTMLDEAAPIELGPAWIR